MSSFYAVIGEFVIFIISIYLVYKLLHLMWTCWLGSALGFGVKWKGSNNTWAIVTGASDGLGFEFAKQMAAKNYAVLLISRNIDKLNNAKSKIEREYPRSRLKLLPLDLSVEANFGILAEQLDQLDNIDVLVNNCGISYSYPEYFTEIPSGDRVIKSILDVNVMAATKVLHLVLPKMVARKRGIVINLSSLSACLPIPLLSVYSASKAYVDYLSRGLSIEYASKGIVIQSLLPGYCKTEMAKIRNTSLMVPTAEKFVRSALKTVGLESRTNGYWGHKIIANSVVSLQSIGDLAMRMYVNNVRTRYYKKVERQKARNNELQTNCDNNRSNSHVIDANNSS